MDNKEHFQLVNVLSVVIHMKLHKLIQNSVDTPNIIFGDQDLKT